jgi:hypothetical protein
MPMAVIDTRLDHYAVIASNRPDVVYVWNHRSALTIPERFSPITLEPNHSLDADLRTLSALLAHNGAVVFYDDPTNVRDYLASEAQVVHALGLRLVDSFPGSRIYAG